MRGHASRSRDLLHLEVSRVRVSQSDLRTGGSVTRMVHVVSSWRVHRVEAEDERVNVTDNVRLFYPNFIIFVVLDP
jgi:hypothetical protein